MSLRCPEFAIADDERPRYEALLRPRVDYSGGCWLWTGPANKAGRPIITLKYRESYAYRVAWALDRGPIPADTLVCHRCDVPLCVRPSHLFLGTMGENSRDMWEKGRAKPLKPRWGEKHHMVTHSDDFVRQAREIAAADLTASMEQLGRELGVSGVTLSAWVHGKTRVQAGGPIRRTAA